jgi:hypothetical protein
VNRFATTLFASALALILLCAPPIGFAQEPAGTGGSGNAPAPSSQTDVSPNGLPESPDATQSNNQQAAPASSSTPSPTANQQAGGAAAAPAVEVTGNAVSRPAGSAIAPPKQRQVRSFLIKMGLIAGAGVALGTVAALSLSSPARVPGSH